MSLPPDNSLAWKVWLGSSVSVLAATVAVAARLLARKISAAPFWWDDWTIMVSLVSMNLTWRPPRSAQVQGGKAHFFDRQCNGAWEFSDGLSLWITITAIMPYTWERISSPCSRRYSCCNQSVCSSDKALMHPTYRPSSVSSPSTFWTQF